MNRILATGQRKLATSVRAPRKIVLVGAYSWKFANFSNNYKIQAPATGRANQGFFTGYYTTPAPFMACVYMAPILSAFFWGASGSDKRWSHKTTFSKVEAAGGDEEEEEDEE